MITFSKLGQYGRLGNQLFQIATTVGTALEYNTNYLFPTWLYNHFLKVPLPTSSNFSISYKTYKEPTTAYQKIHLDHKRYDWDLEGYFQSYKYFDKTATRNLLEFEIETNDNSKEMVAIHVRRGDYTALSHLHYNLDRSYYEKAMSYFPNETFLVFSDDIKFCMHSGWFDPERCYFKVPESVDMGIPLELLHLVYMTKCKGHIIANSSFSWWAAYLAGHNNIIAPNKWVATEKTVEDRIPKEWTVIDAD